MHVRVNVLPAMAPSRTTTGWSGKSAGLEIVIAVSVEAPNQDVLPGPLQLSVDTPVIGAAVHLDCETTVIPQAIGERSQIELPFNYC